MQKTHIQPERLRRLVTDYIDRWETKPWGAEDIAWDQLQANRLTEAQGSAVRFVTLIEDHVPGYLNDVLKHFPLDESVSPSQFLHNREIFRFFVRWAHEEDRHADVFSRYQVRAGVQSEESLHAELGRQGRKTWRFPRELPVQIFTYTVIQEKATQLYYQMLGRTVEEPVLKAILNRIQKDEARHFAFYASVLEAYVEELGQDTLPAIQEALQSFKMPLAEQLDNYWRWSLEVSDTAGGYEHTAAYEELLRVVQRAANASSGSQKLTDWVRAVRAT
jgi:acyl-[acyl-carrier-protein] desaturase